MKNAKVTKILCGILAAVMVTKLLPVYPVSAEGLAEENIVDQELKEGISKEESAAVSMPEKAVEQEPLKGIDMQEESVFVGAQAAKRIEENRQEKAQEEEIETFKEEKESSAADHILESDGQLAHAATQGIVTGTCGENVNFQLDTETGEVIVSGNGKMADYEYATDSPFYPYGDVITSIQIEEGVTSVGATAFAFCFGLIKVDFPNTLTEIGNQAFLGCTSMEIAIVPEQVISIGSYTF